MIIEYSDLPEIRRQHSDSTVVFAGGVFDLVHEGHVVGLDYCKSMGDILIVGVSSDERVKQRKGELRPIRNEAGRLAVINAFKSVDYSFIMPMPTETETPTIQVISSLRPDIFADHIENEHRWEPSRGFIESFGTKLLYNITIRLDSSSEIIDRISALKHGHL